MISRRLAAAAGIAFAIAPVCAEASRSKPIAVAPELEPGSGERILTSEAFGSEVLQVLATEIPGDVFRFGKVGRCDRRFRLDLALVNRGGERQAFLEDAWEVGGCSVLDLDTSAIHIRDNRAVEIFAAEEDPDHESVRLFMRDGSTLRRVFEHEVLYTMPAVLEDIGRVYLEGSSRHSTIEPRANGDVLRVTTVTRAGATETVATREWIWNYDEREFR